MLPAPPSLAAGATPADVVAWVAAHLGDLDPARAPTGCAPGGLRGGQVAADAALAALDVTGYARSRSTVLPVGRQGASRMSPYMRHGLVTLREVWDAVADAPGARPRRSTATSCSGRSTPATSTPASGPRSASRCAWSSRGPGRRRRLVARAAGRADGVHRPRRRRARATAGWSTRPACGWPRSGPCGPAPTGGPARTRCSPTCSTARARPTGWAGSGRSAPAAARPTASAAGRSRSGRRRCAAPARSRDACPIEGWPERRARPRGRGARPRQAPCPAGPTTVEAPARASGSG